MHRPIRLSAIVFVLYALLAYGAMHLINYNPPRGVESLLVAFAMPLNLLTLPWISPLSTLGLTEGEWIRFPTHLGMLIVITFYALVLYLLPRLLSFLRRLFTH